MQDETKNMIAAMLLSMVVLFAWFALFPPEEPTPTETQVAEQSTTGTETTTQSTTTEAPAVPLGPQTRDEALASTDRIAIETDRVKGSISLTGARIDDLKLLEYNQRLNDESEKVTLLSPAGTEDAYFIMHGFAPSGGLTYEDVPNPNTVWSVVEGDKLSVGNPVTLEWKNGRGLTFTRMIEIDELYMFTITQTVENASGETINLAPYGIIAQDGPIKRAAYGRQESSRNGVWILHEGVVMSTGSELTEIDFSHMDSEEYSERERANVRITPMGDDGWIGLTGKYWMTTLIPGEAFDAVSKYTESADRYQAEARGAVKQVTPDSTFQVTSRLFAGAKKYDDIRDYEQNEGVVDFTDSIDWGWFFFLTEPMFQLLNWLNKLIGNMGWAIIGLTVIIKAILFPLAYKSYASMAKMKELQPEMEKLKEKHGDDRQAMQQEVIALYRRKKVNPASGCLPILVQIPIFFSLYKVIFVTLEMRHAPFIGWLHDLSAPDPSSILNLFGLLPWGAPDPTNFLVIFSIGIWPILMGISMWFQQKLNPSPTDDIQKMIFNWLPWVFMFMLGGFASGLVIYWVANNTLTFFQQYAIMRHVGVKPDIFGNIKESFQRKEKG